MAIEFKGPLAKIEVQEDNLGDIDFSKSSLALGCAVKGAQVQWMELEQDDWKVLHLLLTKSVNKDCVPAAMASEGLRALAMLADAAERWMKLNPEKCK